MSQQEHDKGAGQRARSLRARLEENPFYVLGLPCEASRHQIEREGQKLLALLELGVQAVRSYSTPLGTGERNTDLVRAAIAELRDPERRLRYEIWAHLDPGAVVELDAAEGPEDPTTELAWPEAFVALGFSKPNAGRGR